MRKWVQAFYFESPCRPRRQKQTTPPPPGKSVDEHAAWKLISALVGIGVSVLSARGTSVALVCVSAPRDDLETLIRFGFAVFRPKLL